VRERKKKTKTKTEISSGLPFFGFPPFWVLISNHFEDLLEELPVRAINISTHWRHSHREADGILSQLQQLEVEEDIPSVQICEQIAAKHAIENAHDPENQRREEPRRRVFVVSVQSLCDVH
jgi:hypothetical protein